MKFFQVNLIFLVLIYGVNARSENLDSKIIQSQAECNKSSATEWSASLNRCVGKVEARNTRHEVQACDQIIDQNEKAECFKKVAEQKSGLNSNPDSLSDGNTNKSAVMNGVGTAYTLVGIINSLGGGGSQSQCTSKKIFGITAMAGTASDIWLKIKARDQLDDLKGKYKIDEKATGYSNQIKAFQYLKDEQQTVKDIANREMKRNMLLMIGYGASSVMAIYEMISPHPECWCPKGMVATKNGQCGPPEKTTDTTTQPQVEDSSTQLTDETTEEVSSDVTTQEQIPNKESTDVIQKPDPAKENIISEEVKGRKFEAVKDNGVTKIYEVGADGKRTGNYVVGDQIWDKSGNKVGPVNLQNDKFYKFGDTSAEIPTKELKGMGVYQSKQTDQASSIKFNTNGGNTRTQMNGATVIINEKKK